MRAFLIACLTVITLSSVIALQEPSAGSARPMVTGPVALTTALRDPGHGYPYNATPMDLARPGYVEEEFLIQGTANRYNTPAGETGSVIDGGHAYRTRLVVRRPKSASRFNGTAVIEWYNVSQGHDGEYDWFQSMDHLVRSGYAWVGVSNQAAGVSSLKEWSPTRYGTLDVSEGGAIMGDALSYDIFTAAALAIRGKASKDVMGGLKVARLIAIGHSQSAGRLYTYFHSVHPLFPAAYDAVILHGGGGKVRPDLRVKVFKFLDETDVPGQVSSRQPDSGTYRQWEVAGSSHLNAQFSRAMAGIGLRVSGMNPVDGSPSIDGPTISGGAGNGAPGNGDGAANAGPTGGCEKPPFSRIPSHYALNAAIDHTARWIKDGTPPPPAPPVETREAPPGSASVPAQPGRGGRAAGATGPRWVVVRDEWGNAIGGIRLSQHGVPTATNTGVNTGGQAGGERNCGLMGSHEPFDTGRLASLYPTHAVYVSKVKELTDKNLKAGYLVKVDANATIVEAERSDIGGARTAWGDPDLQGIWTSDDMRGVPRERPDEFGTRQVLTREELARRIEQDQQTLRQQLRGPYGARNDLRSRTFGQTSLIVDPPDGKMPPLTAEAQSRATSRDRGSFGQGPFDGPEDFTLFDRCITRGVAGSILPVIYGNGNQIIQAPGSVAITYEMIHDTRVIPLDGRPHVGGNIHLYLGDARGHWEGGTLVVETTNFTDRTSISENGNGLRHSEALRLVERLTRLDGETLEYRLTVDDPGTYARPWTMSLFLTSPRGYELLPYDCHEGNHGLPNILSAERAEDSAVEEDAKRGVQRPRRARNGGNGPAVEGSER